MYYKLKQYQLALENQLKCLDIELKVLPKDHKTFAETYKNIATTYEKLRQFDEAIQFANKYIEQLKLHHLQGSEELNEAMNLLKTIQVKRD
jgi:tetratricopeptide (TPR) repeat protein